MSDIFTKCLGSQLFYKHRLALGFEQREFPPETMSMLIAEDDEHDERMMIGLNHGRQVAVVEVCCEPDSCLSTLTLKGNQPYIGIVQDVQSDEVLREVSKLVKGWKKQNFWAHVHVSTPCASGSPLKRVSEDTQRRRIWNGNQS